MGIAKVKDKYFLTIITADNYLFYFVPITHREATVISSREQILIEDHQGPVNEDDMVIGEED